MSNNTPTPEDAARIQKNLAIHAVHAMVGLGFVPTLIALNAVNIGQHDGAENSHPEECLALAIDRHALDVFPPPPQAEEAPSSPAPPVKSAIITNISGGRR